MLHLIQPRQLFGPEARQNELQAVWYNNDLAFDEVTAIDHRPTFTRMFSLCKPNAVNVIANSDIYFDREDLLALLAFVNWTPKHAMALSRWDVPEEGAPVLWDHPDSQDAWIVYGDDHHIDAPFRMGVPGCDNSLLHILQRSGYTVTNPALTIRAYHLHNVDYRSYLAGGKGNARVGDKIERIPPPYAFVKPTAL